MAWEFEFALVMAGYRLFELSGVATKWSWTYSRAVFVAEELEEPEHWKAVFAAKEIEVLGYLRVAFAKEGLEELEHSKVLPAKEGHAKLEQHEEF